jgi:hypothetical protein
MLCILFSKKGLNVLPGKYRQQLDFFYPQAVGEPFRDETRTTKGLMGKDFTDQSVRRC